MSECKITKDVALKTIGQNFDLFETWYLIYMNPGKKLPWVDNTFITVGSKSDKCSSEEAYFQAGLTTITTVHSKDGYLEFSFDVEALQAVWDYANYYNLMKGMAEKDIGIVMSDEKDEYGLPQFVGIPEKLLETEQELISIYGENWRDIFLEN